MFFSLADPFTFETAERFRGQNVMVVVRDDGIQHAYYGVLEPLTTGRTKVGEVEVFNECVFQLRLAGS